MEGPVFNYSLPEKRTHSVIVKGIYTTKSKTFSIFAKGLKNVDILDNLREIYDWEKENGYFKKEIYFSEDNKTRMSHVIQVRTFVKDDCVSKSFSVMLHEFSVDEIAYVLRKRICGDCQ